MKLSRTLSILLFLITLISSAQGLSEKVKEVSSKIPITEKGERLKWMDSLTALTEFNAEYKYDSIANSTILYAIELDSMKVATNRISDLIYYYSTYNIGAEKSIELYKKYLYLTPRMFHDDLSRFYLNTSNVYQYMGNHDDALKLLDSSLLYAKRANSIRLEGFSKLYKGQIFSSKGKYAEASQFYKEVDAIFTKEQDTFYILSAKNSLSILYSQNGFFEEAEALRKEAIDLAIANNEDGYLASIYSNQATDLSKQNRLKESIHSMKLAINSLNKTGYAEGYVAPLMSELASKYIAADSLEKAKVLIDSLANNQKLISNGINLWMYRYALRQYEFARGNYQKALELGKLTLEYNVTQFKTEELIASEKFLADVYHKLNDFENESFHLKNYMRLNDSINSVKKTNALSYYQTLYETEKRDHTIESQKNDLDLFAQKNKVKNQYLLFGGTGLLALFGFILLIRSRKNLREKEERQASFSKNLLYAQEIERTRVAKDLHDGVGQKLTMLIRKAENKEQAEFASMATDTLEEVRTISRALYPPMLEKLGLSKCISHLLLEIDEETEMFVSSEIDDIDAFFNEEETVTFYRFVQESVSNVIKHAEAKTLMVKISLENKQLNAIIQDNGIGFSEEDENIKESLGMKTLAERIKLLKGKFSINSSKKKGTNITATITK